MSLSVEVGLLLALATGFASVLAFALVIAAAALTPAPVRAAEPDPVR